VPVEVLLGDTDLDSAHVGVVGKLKDDRRTVAVSFAKPQCMVLLGYMGSGKSYGLGVLIENALLSIPNLSSHRNSLSVVAFNFRRNPEARFEYWGFRQPNSKPPEVARLRSEYMAEPVGIERLNVFGYGPELQRRQDEYRGIPTFPIQFRADELGADHWEILMKPPSPQAEYMDVVRDIIQKLFYQERLTLKNLEKHIQTDERLSPMQRRKAETRLSFAQRWLCDDREYEWSDVLTGGALNVFDLRMQTMTSADALKLCLVITDLVRRTKNGVNKVVVFDEAHEYVDSKELVGELENAITQIRHDGLSFILASQFPDRIPATIFKYLLTRLIFKLPNLKAINYVRKAAPNLDGLSPQKVSNLDLEQGVCFVQTDDDCTDSLLKVPQLLAVRPRCTLHGGETIRSRNSSDPPPEPDA
jgi:DNA phosphorothioation-dependent restriction protein DptH